METKYETILFEMSWLNSRGLGINFRIFCRNEFKIFVQMIGIKVKLHYALKSTLNSLPGEEYGPR